MSNRSEIDYCNWGKEYLIEAERMKKRLEEIRRESVPMSTEERISALQRANILYSMYLECRNTGRLLSVRGESFAEREGKYAN